MTESDEDRWHPGRRVCIVGQGTSAILHTHKYTVQRLTKTLIVVAMDGHPKTTYRFNRERLTTVPYDTWGGCRIDTKCQKKDLQ